jgi:formylglycine-generating enzyme required for sulfatase activity
MGGDGRTVEPNERPLHAVPVAPFWIDRTEVTVADMRACIARGACVEPTVRGIACTLPHGEGNLPMNCVSWEGADAYCRAAGKRLPTEAEWEFAARGTERIRFPWGAAFPTCATAVTLRNSRSGISCSPNGPGPVGSHPRGASPFGVLDMAGNVEEWVTDWYADRYEASGTTTAATHGPAFGAAHVLRGGSWMSPPREVRVSARNWGSANEAGSNVGFRCAKD